MRAQRMAWFAGPPRPSFLRACHPICSSRRGRAASYRAASPTRAGSMDRGSADPGVLHAVTLSRSSCGGARRSTLRLPHGPSVGKLAPTPLLQYQTVSPDKPVASELSRTSREKPQSLALARL